MQPEHMTACCGYAGLIERFRKFSCSICTCCNQLFGKLFEWSQHSTLAGMQRIRCEVHPKLPYYLHHFGRSTVSWSQARLSGSSVDVLYVECLSFWSCGPSQALCLLVASPRIGHSRWYAFQVEAVIFRQTKPYAMIQKREDAMLLRRVKLLARLTLAGIRFGRALSECFRYHRKSEKLRIRSTRKSDLDFADAMLRDQN